MEGFVSLGTVFLAFLPVALLFLLAEWGVNRRALNRPAVVVLLAESLVVTLFAALWFGSLGHGGWLLLFLLLGTLVSGAERGLRSAFLRSSEPAELRLFGVGVAKYLVAGAILAWRLG